MTAVADPTKLSSSLSLHPAQFSVYANKARFKCVVAGRRWGKTHLARTMLIKYASVPKRRVWYIAPTYQMAKQIMFNDLNESLPRAWVKKVHKTELRFSLWNGSEIQLKGADNPDTLRGVGLDFCVMDEYQDMHDDTWSLCIRPTLAQTGGDALFIGTPKGFQLLYDRWAEGQDPDKQASGQWMSWQFVTANSPFVPLSEVEAAKRDMTDREFRQEFEASFETMSGRVYYPFDRELHVKKCPFNPDLPVWVGQDFNIDPMSSVVIQPQPNGEIWIVDELVLPGSNVVEVCEELSRRYWRHEKTTTIYPDPAGASRQHARGESSLDIFREHGFNRISYRRKHPAIQDRVNAVNRQLMNAEGVVNLFVDPRCRQTIMSLEQTLYRESSPMIDKRPGVEHVTDALGYCIEKEYPLRRITITGVSI